MNKETKKRVFWIVWPQTSYFIKYIQGETNFCCFIWIQMSMLAWVCRKRDWTALLVSRMLLHFFRTPGDAVCHSADRSAFQFSPGIYAVTYISLCQQNEVRQGVPDQLLVHSFNKGLLNSYYVLGAVRSSGVAENKILPTRYSQY